MYSSCDNHFRNSGFVYSADVGVGKVVRFLIIKLISNRVALCVNGAAIAFKRHSVPMKLHLINCTRHLSQSPLNDSIAKETAWKMAGNSHPRRRVAYVSVFWISIFLQCRYVWKVYCIQLVDVIRECKLHTPNENIRFLFCIQSAIRLIQNWNLCGIEVSSRTQKKITDSPCDSIDIARIIFESILNEFVFRLRVWVQFMVAASASNWNVTRALHSFVVWCPIGTPLDGDQTQNAVLVWCSSRSSQRIAAQIALSFTWDSRLVLRSSLHAIAFHRLECRASAATIPRFLPLEANTLPAIYFQ